MSGLAAGLARGLAMYGQGRMIAEDREYERQQKEAERKRQEARDAVLMEQTRLSMENTRQEMERRKAQDGIEAETRMNAARADGYRPVQDATRLATSLEAADSLVPGLGVHGRAMQQQAATADRTVNGTAMARIGESDTERQNRMAKQEQQGLLMQQAAEQNRMLETIRAQLPKAVRPLAVDLKTAQTLLGKYADQRMAPPKAGPAPLTQKDDNGNLWFSTDGGRSWNPSRINTGASAAPTDAPRSQPVPVNPTAALSQAPGSGFSSQFQLPAPVPSRQAPPAGAMPTFGSKNKPRPLPNAVVEDLRQNSKTLSVIQQAIQGLEQNPDAVGLHNYLPDVVLNRWNVKGFRDGVDVRANVGDIGSMTVKDRSGASVTVSEAPRLKPFVPSANDDPQTALKKLRRMAQIIEQDNMEIQSFYGDMGSMYGRGSEPDMNDPGFQAFLAAQLQGRRP